MSVARQAKRFKDHPPGRSEADRLQQVAGVVNSDLRDLFSIQDEILGESLDFENLDVIEKDALSVLS